MRTDELGNPIGRLPASHRVVSDVIRIHPATHTGTRPDFRGRLVRIVALAGSIAALALAAGYRPW